MAKEGEGEEGGELGCIDVAPSSAKRLFMAVKQNRKKSSGSASNRYPLRLRNPDLSNCHVCASQNNSQRGKDKLRTLDSQWRIVIICNTCFKNLQSAKNCSYCFEEMSELGTSCRVCSRRVHQGCISLYGRLNSGSDSGSFTCIDCWVPKSISKFGCNSKHTVSSRIGLHSFSTTTPKFSSNLKDSSKSLQDAAKDAKSVAEKKLANAAKARLRASEKAVAARQATVVAAKSLDLAVIAATEETQANGTCPLIDDAELAMRLHRAINSSPRIFKNVGSVRMDTLHYPKKLKFSDSVLATQSDSGNQIASDLEVGTDDSLLENSDKAASEPSMHSTLDHGSFGDTCTLGSRSKLESKITSEEFRRNGDVCRMLNSVTRELDASDVEKSDFRECIEELLSKEEQASCSSAINIFRGNYNTTDSGSRSCHYQEGLNHSAPCQSVYDEDSSLPKEKTSNGPNIILRTYSRRCHRRNLYIKKYSRRHTNTKGFLGQNSNFSRGTFHLASQTSGNCTTFNADEQLRSADLQ